MNITGCGEEPFKQERIKDWSFENINTWERQKKEELKNETKNLREKQDKKELREIFS